MGATWSALEETGLVAGVMAPSPVAVPDDDMPFAPTKSVAAVPRVRRDFVASPALRLALSNYTGSAIETDASSQQSSMHAQDGALIAELSVRLRRRPDASSLQFILNVAQLLGQSAHNAPLLLPLLPMILHGMARHLESDGVQECGVGLFANLAVPRGSRSSLVANGCLQHAFLSLRQYPDNPMLQIGRASCRERV